MKVIQQTEELRESARFKSQINLSTTIPLTKRKVKEEFGRSGRVTAPGVSTCADGLPDWVGAGVRSRKRLRVQGFGVGGDEVVDLAGLAPGVGGNWRSRVKSWAWSLWTARRKAM